MRRALFYSELAYAIGIIGLALGTAFMEKANMGLSMVVAPAYLLYLKLSQVWPFVTFGMAEYTIQGCLLVVMVVVLRKFKVSYLFFFITAIIYGLTLDRCIALIAHLMRPISFYEQHFIVVAYCSAPLASLLFFILILPQRSTSCLSRRCPLKLILRLAGSKPDMTALAV